MLPPQKRLTKINSLKSDALWISSIKNRALQAVVYCYTHPLRLRGEHIKQRPMSVLSCLLVIGLRDPLISHEMWRAL
jgi:hypothetical protein